MGDMERGEGINMCGREGGGEQLMGE